MAPSRSHNDALRGPVDLLVLKTLSLTRMHGWGISQRVQQLSRGTGREPGLALPGVPAGAEGEELASWRRLACGLEAVLRDLTVRRAKTAAIIWYDATRARLGLLFASASETRMSEEMRFHIEMEADMRSELGIALWIAPGRARPLRGAV